jgi:hypothetical protein
MTYAVHDYYPEYEARKVTITQMFLSPFISRNKSGMFVSMYKNVRTGLVSTIVSSLFFLCFEKFSISHYKKAYDSLDGD